MSLQQKLKDELKAVARDTLYFGTWLAAFLLLKQLVLADYQVAFQHYSMALVGALILSKVVLLLEKGFEARHEYGGFGPAVGALFRNTDVPQVWAETICLSGALLGFNVRPVIRRHLGAGGLLRLLMSPLPEELEAKPPRSESLSR